MRNSKLFGFSIKLTESEYQTLNREKTDEFKNSLKEIEKDFLFDVNRKGYQIFKDTIKMIGPQRDKLGRPIVYFIFNCKAIYVGKKKAKQENYYKVI